MLPARESNLSPVQPDLLRWPDSLHVRHRDDFAIRVGSVSMLGSSDTTPLDLAVTCIPIACSVILGVGVVYGGSWPASVGAGVRRSTLLIAVLLFVAAHVLHPTRSGIVGAGRLVTLWPTGLLFVLLFVACPFVPGVSRVRRRPLGPVPAGRTPALAS